MKTYEELNATEQDAALLKCTNSLLEAICNGEIRFNDSLNEDDLQARIDAAFNKAEVMDTPWFASEYIMETCKADIEGMAICEAQDALYSVSGEIIIHGVAL